MDGTKRADVWARTSQFIPAGRYWTAKRDQTPLQFGRQTGKGCYARDEQGVGALFELCVFVFVEKYRIIRLTMKEIVQTCYTRKM